MTTLKHLLQLTLLASLPLWACDGITDVPDSRGMRIEIQVSGGFAGVSYAFEVSGRDAEIRGLTCVSGCTFVPGDVLATLSVAQVQSIAEDMEATGILDLDGTDFGNQCCDQFHYHISYDNGLETSVIQGSTGTLPEAVLRAVDSLESLARGRQPVIVALESDPTRFPRDPIALGEITLEGHTLTATVFLRADSTGIQSYHVSLRFDAALDDELDLVSATGFLPAGFDTPDAVADL